MASNKFKSFLKNLGFSENDFKEDLGNIFVYEIPIDETQSETVQYVHTPTDNDVFDEHRRFWNRNNVNTFVAVGNDKTYLIDAKVKPNKEKPINSKIKSFDYGTNSVGFEKERLQEITKDAVDATYFFDFVIKNRKKPQEVDKDLLLNLIALRNDLLDIKNDDQETIHLLILRCLFIKYLEDKKIYPEGYLINALNSQPLRLIEAFEEIKKINGDIFKFDKQVLEAEIDERYLQNLFRFFTSDYRSEQGRLFPYLFDQIPIQLISNVYEAFLHNDKRQGKGIYYTPTFLVNFMLSHSLKEKLKEKENVSVFDPAVGSGAFLVESFKAIVKPGDSYEKKKAILQNQLFGADIDQNALQIAAFSLYLALIETEKSEFIRQQIEISNPILPSLIGNTLIQANSITDDIFKNKTFDCIVSNPPWGSVKPTPKNQEPNKENEKERKEIDTNPVYKNVSRYERSQAFLVKAKKWANEKTIFSLVVKNSLFLNDNPTKKNNKPKEFRAELLNSYQINYFYELSSYTKILFEKREIGEVHGKTITTGATEPCAVLVFELPKSENHKIKYISPKLNDFSETFQAIYYTQRDTKEVEQIRFLQDDLLWRIFVNGDFEDYKLIKKIKEQACNYEVICSKGFEDWIGGEFGEPEIKKWIKSEDFERYNIKGFRDYNWNKKRRRPGNPELYSGNRILIAIRPKPKDNFRIRGIFTNEEIVFEKDIIGLKFKNVSSQIPFLGIINSRPIGYTLFHTSTGWQATQKMDVFRISDIKQLPIPCLKKDDIFTEKITSLVNSISKNTEINFFETETSGFENEIDTLVFDLYNLKEYEKEIIREFYQINVERVGKKRKLVTDLDIKEYALKFAEIFGLMIDSGSKLVAIKYHISRSIGTAICFSILNKTEEEKIQNDQTLELLNLVKKHQLKKVDTTRILKEEKVKIYDGKLMYIIKSNLFKDWTIRQSIKDANEEIGLILSKLPTRK